MLKIRRRHILVVIVIVLIIIYVSIHLRCSSFMDDIQYYVGNPRSYQNDNIGYSIQRKDLYYSISSRSSNKVISSLEINYISTTKITVIALAGETRKNHPGYQNFRKSLAYSGYSDIKILNPEVEQEILSLKVTNISAESLFWVKRLAQFEKFTHNFESHALLLFCDAYDVFFGLPPEILTKRYRSLNKPVIFSTEILCDTVSCRTDYNVKEWFQSISPNSNPSKYLNAGMFMGTAIGLQNVLQCAVNYAKQGRDDQTAFSICFREMPDIIGLDYNSYLFGNIPPYDPIFHTAWQFRDDNMNITSQLLLLNNNKKKTNMLHQSNFKRTDNLLSISPILHRISLDNMVPVVIHFPGMSFRPNSYIPFNLCQQNLRWRYNHLGSMIFKEAVRPVLFHPLQNKYLRLQSSSLFDRIVISLTIDISNLLLLQRTQYLLTSLQSQTWPPDAIYIALINNKRNKNQNKELLKWKLQYENQKATVVMHNYDDDYDSRGIIKVTHSAILTVLDVEKDPNTIIITLNGNYFYDKKLIEVLAEKVIRNPVNAYGVLGAMIDIERIEVEPKRARMSPSKYDKNHQYSNSHLDIRNHAHNRMERKHTQNNDISYEIVVRSAGHWIFTHEPVSVDVLSWEQGVAFRRSYFDLNQLLKYMTRVLSSDDTCQDHESIIISAYLSTLGIPRIQLPDTKEISFATVNNKLEDSSNHHHLIIDTTYSPKQTFSSSVDSCARLLLQDFQISKIYHSDPSTTTSSPTTTTDTSDIDYNFNFDAIPPVADLSGFSWPPNWEVGTDTSPCTCHLKTRISKNALYLGTEQYLNENQIIWSTSKLYYIKLLQKGKLCSFSNYDNIMLHCLEIPEQLMKVNNAAVSSYYTAIFQGDLCFFQGNSPYFGGTKLDSGHRNLVYCSLSSPSSTTAVRNNNIPDSRWEEVYLSIDDNNGEFGLYLSPVGTHDMVLPEYRRQRMKIIRKL